MSCDIIDNISVVVLTLKNSHRLDRGIVTYPKFLPSYDIFYGIKPGDPDSEPPDWYLDYKEYYTGHKLKSTYCCYMSKLKCFDNFHKNNKDNKHLLFLEDDVAFLRFFEPAFKNFMSIVPDDWDMISFGGSHYKLPHEVTPNVLRATCMWGSECLLINARFFDKLIEEFGNIKKYNNNSDMVLQSDLIGTVYTPLTRFATQLDGYSYITDTYKNTSRYNTFDYIDTAGNIKQATNALIYKYL